MTAKEKSGGMLYVRQVRSGIGYERSQGATLKALGLGKLDRVRKLPDNPQVRGMINKVCHLVKLVSAPESADRPGSEAGDEHETT